MKTVVLGLFDDLEDARRVLGQLATSPLDLSAIEVVRRDVASQSALTHEAGLGGRRAPWAAVLAGGLLGATAGALAGQGPLASLGPLLAMAAGLIVGAIAGAALAGFSDTLRVPPAHAGEMLEAVQAGATAIVVRTDNLPTARAIGDLFTACGSRDLSALDAGEGIDEDKATAPAVVGTAAGTIDPPSSREKEPTDAIFAPPWRRGVPQPDAEPTPDVVTVPPPPAASEPPAVVESTRAEAPDLGAEGVTWSAARAAGTADRADKPAQPTVSSPGAPVRFEPLPTTPAEPPSPPSASPSPATTDAPAAAIPVDASIEATIAGDAEAEPEGVTLADDADIIVLGLSARHARALRDAGIPTVGQLADAMERVERGDLAIPGIGPAGARTIREQLDGAGVRRPASEPTDVPRLLREAIRDIRAERE